MNIWEFNNNIEIHIVKSDNSIPWVTFAYSSFDRACFKAAQWIVIAERLGATVKFAAVGSEDCTGFSSFVSIEPDIAHCELLRCFRSIVFHGDCDDCNDADDLFPDIFGVEGIRSRHGANKLIEQWLQESQQHIKVLSKRLAMRCCLDRKALLSGISLPTPYDATCFVEDAIQSSIERDK